MARLRQRVAVFLGVALAATLAVAGISSLAMAQQAETIETRIARLEEAVLQLQAPLGDPETGTDMRWYLTYLRSEANSYRAALEEDRDHFLGLAKTAAWVIGVVGSVLLAFAYFMLGRSIGEAKQNLQHQLDQEIARLQERADDEFGRKLAEAVEDIVGDLSDTQKKALALLAKDEARVRRSKVLVLADADQLDEMKNAVRHLEEHGVVVESRPIDDNLEVWFAKEAAGVNLVAYRYSVDAGSETDKQFGYIVTDLRRLDRGTPLVIYVPGGKRIEGEDVRLYNGYFPVDLANTSTTLSQKIRQNLRNHPLKDAEPDEAAGKKRAEKA